MVLLALPRYVALKNKYNSKYLSYRKNDSHLDHDRDEDVTSPATKFAVEPSSSGNGQVHLRSCYNNKYLVKESSNFYVAGAGKPDEDTSKFTCTLFEPVPVDDDGKLTVRFRDVYSAKYAILCYEVGGVHSSWLYLNYDSSPNSQYMDAFEIINWDSLVIFPSQTVVFKGSNDTYLGAYWFQDMAYQQYSIDDRNSDKAAYTVCPARDGNVQVYSRYFKKYWSVHGWILADRVEKSPDDPEALFTPIKIGSNVIALRSVAYNLFLRGLDLDFKVQCLNARDLTITNETHITVEELFMSRSIYNIVYRQDDGRIYNVTPIVCGTGAVYNDSNEEDSITIPINYKEAKSTCWQNSVSLSVGISTTFQTGVPLIAEGEIDFEVSVTGEHQWGGTVDASFQTGSTYTAKVGPKKQVKVTYVATKGTCDVPFSYTQEDVYSDGTRSITQHDDGIFTGVNCYNFSYRKEEVPL